MLKLIVVGMFFLNVNLLHSKDPTGPKVIYGTDDRIDFIEETPDILQKYISSIVGIIPRSKLKVIQPFRGFYQVTGDSYGESRDLCENERFYHQLTAFSCSGSLVGEDTILTAGHCVLSSRDCKNYAFVFGFLGISNKEGEYIVSENDVFFCHEVINRKFLLSKKMDYALLKMDRKATYRDYFSLRKEENGEYDPSDELFILGHPAGLPLKGQVGIFPKKYEEGPTFVIESDTFEGNSGSPVINSRTGVIEGILIQGESDYVFNSEEGCYQVNRCEEDECDGEEVLKAQKIPSF